jgi:hypothetical protein
MKINGTRWVLACLSIAVMTAPVALAQQTNGSNPYQGVSQPPPDDTIVANQDIQNAAASKVKPSPVVPATAAASQASPSQSYAPVVTPRSTENNSRYDNTDYGIVTVPGQSTMASPASPTLQTRQQYDADDDIVNPPPPSSNELAEGTEIQVRITDQLSSRSTAVGSSFHGEVMHDVTQNGSVIIPAGSTLRGRVVHVSQGHHFGPAAELRLRPDVVILPDGTAYHLYAQVMRSEASGTRTGSEGAIEPSSHAVKKTAEYGIGVGTGALVGAELAGPAGALAGSLAGAGLVTAHLLTQHPTAATITPGSKIIFFLTEPMELTPTRN